MLLNLIICEGSGDSIELDSSLLSSISEKDVIVADVLIANDEVTIVVFANALEKLVRCCCLLNVIVGVVGIELKYPLSKNKKTI